MSGVNKTLVTIATYNEIENLPRLVDEVFSAAPGADVLVIDDASPDGTGQWCARRAAEDSRVHCVVRGAKLGLGTAIIAAMRYAIQHGYQYVLNMDGDFSHHPRYLPALVAGMEARGQETHAQRGDEGERVDVMIGSRYVRGGGAEGWPLSRRLMSRLMNLATRWLLGLSPRDCSGGYRCYRIACLAQLDLGAIRSRGYAFQEEILWRLKRLGARFGETPIVFSNRQRGVSKLRLTEVVSAMWIIFRLGMLDIRDRFRGNYRRKDGGTSRAVTA